LGSDEILEKNGKQPFMRKKAEESLGYYVK
jgi:hypothetical protein